MRRYVVKPAAARAWTRRRRADRQGVTAIVQNGRALHVLQDAPDRRHRGRATRLRHARRRGAHAREPRRRADRARAGAVDRRRDPAPPRGQLRGRPRGARAVRSTAARCRGRSTATTSADGRRGALRASSRARCESSADGGTLAAMSAPGWYPASQRRRPAPSAWWDGMPHADRPDARARRRQQTRATQQPPPGGTQPQQPRGATRSRCAPLPGPRLPPGAGALQQTFLRAHRALVGPSAPDDVRPVAQRRTSDPCRCADQSREAATERRADRRGPRRRRRAPRRPARPARHRPAAGGPALRARARPIGDLSHAEIAGVIDVREAKVKALVHQARYRLHGRARGARAPVRAGRASSSPRAAASCAAAAARHLAVCEPCRDFKDAVRDQRVALGLVLPVVPERRSQGGDPRHVRRRWRRRGGRAHRRRRARGEAGDRGRDRGGSGRRRRRRQARPRRPPQRAAPAAAAQTPAPGRTHPGARGDLRGRRGRRPSRRVARALRASLVTPRRCAGRSAARRRPRAEGAPGKPSRRSRRAKQQAKAERVAVREQRKAEGEAREARRPVKPVKVKRVKPVKVKAPKPKPHPTPATPRQSRGR